MIFRESIKFGKNDESLVALKAASIILGYEPTYFLPFKKNLEDEIYPLLMKGLDLDSIQEKMTHLFFNNSNLSEITQIPFKNFISVVHLDLSGNNLFEFPQNIGKLFFFFFFLLSCFCPSSLLF